MEEFKRADQIIERFSEATGSLQSIVHSQARAMGYYDILDRITVDEDTHAYAVVTLLALVHSEVTETLMEVRTSHAAVNPAPAGGKFADELADIVLRVMDVAEFTGVHLGEAIDRKLHSSADRGALEDRRF